MSRIEWKRRASPLAGLLVLGLLTVALGCGDDDNDKDQTPVPPGPVTRSVSGTIAAPDGVQADLEGTPAVLSELTDTGLQQLSTGELAADGSFSLEGEAADADSTVVVVATLQDAVSGLAAAIGGLIAPGTVDKPLDGATHIACLAGVRLVARFGRPASTVNAATIALLEASAASFVADTNFLTGGNAAAQADALLVSLGLVTQDEVDQANASA